MKKLTSLQILMILGLGLNTSVIFSSDEDMNVENMHEAVEAELDSAETEAARLDVLTGLAELYPMQVERIIMNESDLESNFNSIRNFINKKNIEIESLLEKNEVNEAEVARLAVELADAKSELQNTIAKQRAKHKKPHKQEQSISDSFIKAGQNITRLWNKNIGRPFNNYKTNTSAKYKKAFSSPQGYLEASKEAWTKNPFRTPDKPISKKAVRAEQAMYAKKPMLMDSADEAIAMMDNQMMDDEVMVQSMSSKKSQPRPSKPEPRPSKPEPKQKAKKKSKKS